MAAEIDIAKAMDASVAVFVNPAAQFAFFGANPPNLKDITSNLM
ncbi:MULTISPECIES: hypothetical protein [Rhizobium]|nr:MULTISPECIES: hypothetical protein [Rhizobium]